MEQYKEQLNKIASAPETYQKIEDIGKKHTLNIDQMGELAASTRDVIMGFKSSSTFIGDIRKRMEVDHAKAALVANDVDEQIFKSIKDLLVKTFGDKGEISEKPAPQKPAPSVTPIERAGKFNIEKPPVSQSPQYNHLNLNRQAVLNDLENIEKLKPENANNFVEHLLSNPVSNPVQTEAQKIVSAPTNLPTGNPTPAPQPKQAPVQKKYDTDPYREQI